MNTEYAGPALGFRTDSQWVGELLEEFPREWQSHIMSQWTRAHRTDRAGANLRVLSQSQAVQRSQRAGIAPDASDWDLCEQARQSARDMQDKLGRVEAAHRGEAQLVIESAQWVRAFEVLESRGLGDAADKAMRASRSMRAFVKRVCCDRWWRRVLRRIHAVAVESAARALGLVARDSGCYVSHGMARRRAAQIERNDRALESVKAINEDGESYTLAELAGVSAANKSIRRNELMTRIAGFELIARDLGHTALFVTVTCPPRMHASHITRADRSELNGKWDGTRPDEAQRYLGRQWARMRAAADRAGCRMYGFRIAEPNHDGTPHWHMLVFFDPVVGSGRRKGRAVADRVVLTLFRRYFLENRADRGQRRHAVKVERIDWARGSAAGYVAKYVAKNIDGAHVGTDGYGREATEAARRVDAWAATWRIRQFQQIGGAPVGVWRELRRVHPEQAEIVGSGLLGSLLDAVNGIDAGADAESDAVRTYTAASGWRDYVTLQGGVYVRRDDLAVVLEREQTGELGTYGDVCAPRPCGVIVREQVEEIVPPVGIVTRPMRRVRWMRSAVRSERKAWRIVPGASLGAVRDEIARAKELEFLKGAEGSLPRSPVINCTGARLFAPTDRQFAKLGKVPRWSKKGKTGGGEPKREGENQ